MFPTSHDYYGILGVSKDATEEEIRSLYKKLMKEHHPDQFAGLRKKYEALGDEDLLKVIDEKIRQAEEMCKLINVKIAYQSKFPVPRNKENKDYTCSNYEYCLQKFR